MAMRFRFLRSFFLAALLLSLFPCVVAAQPQLLLISPPDTTDFPDVSVQFYAIDRQGALLRDFNTDHFVVRENGQERPVVDVTCPPITPPTAVSAVLTIDVSLSMGRKDGGMTRLDLAKLAARTWIEEMEEGYECAITSFSGGNYLNQDFTTDRTLLTNALNYLTGEGSTNFTEGLVGWPGGGVTVASRGRNRRIVIFVTDGVSGEVNTGQIILSATQANVEVYCIVLGASAGTELKQIAESTGGQWFDGVKTADQMQAIYRTIHRRMQGHGPCSLTWRSELDCNPHRFVQIASATYALDGYTFYAAPARTQTDLLVTPENLSFGPVPPGNTRELTLTLTSEDKPVTIVDIVSGNPLFTVKEIQEDSMFLPKTLSPGDVLQATIRFSPIDSSIVTDEVTIKTDQCVDRIVYCSGGFPADFRPSVRLVHPNGGEKFDIGIDTIIRWEGILAGDPVRLEYSIDSGTTWNTVASRALGLRHPWNVPATPSDQCLARITQLNPDRSVGVFEHSLQVVDARFLSDDRIVTLDEGGRLRIWNVQTGALTGELPGDDFAHHLVVSPDSRYAATGGNIDGGVTLWDIGSGGALHVILDAYLTGGGVNRNIKSPLCFTPDGTLILTAKVERRTDVSARNLRLYDVRTGLLRREFQDIGFECRYAIFSPDGSRSALGGTNGVIQVRDTSLRVIIQTLNDPNGDVVRLAFSPDGRELLSVAEASGGRSTLTLWDIDAGVRISSTPLSRSTGSIDYSPVLRDALIADGESTIRRLATGRTEREFIGHNAPVNTAYFSTDGELVITTSDDRTARVWRIDDTFVRTDLSDSLWAIVAPDIRSRDVEFGTVRVRSGKDSLLIGYVHNAGTTPAEVVGMKISGPHRGDFSILSGHAPFTLAPGEARDVELAFRPDIPGDRQAILEIETKGEKILQRLHGTGVEAQLKIVGLPGDFINFGPVPLGRSSDSFAVGVNVGSAPLEITALTQSGPDDRQFTILGPDLGTPILLPPGDSIRIFVRFLPARLGFAQGGIKVEYSGEGSPAFIGLLGEGISPSDAAISVLPLVEFASQSCAAFPDTMIVEIANPGNAPLLVSDATVDGAHRTDFVLIPSFVPLTIPPGESRPLNVAFTPSDEGDRTARLRLVSNASNAPESFIELQGRLEKAALSIAQTSIDLGILCPGEMTEIMLTVRNLGLAGTKARTMILQQSGGVIEAPLNGIAIAGEDSTEVMFRFIAGTDDGPFKGEIGFIDTLCGSSAIVKVEGEIGRPDVAIDPVPQICSGEAILLVASGAERYSWSPADGLSCTDCPEPTARPVRTTTYTVTGHDAEGCEGIDSVTVAVRESPVIVHGEIDRDYRARSGETVKIGVELKDGAPELSELTELELAIDYDPLVMTVDLGGLKEGLKDVLLDGWSVEIIDGTNGHLRLRLKRGSGPALSGPGVLFYLSCRPFLSRVPGTEISLEIQDGSYCLDFETADGYIGVDSLCALPYRLFEIALTKYSLGEVAPNPSYGSILAIPFSLGLDGHTRLEVFDDRGELVAVLVNGYLEAGAYGVNWDVREAGSGGYYYRITSGDWSETKRVVVVK